MKFGKSKYRVSVQRKLGEKEVKKVEFEKDLKIFIAKLLGKLTTC